MILTTVDPMILTIDLTVSLLSVHIQRTIKFKFNKPILNDDLENIQNGLFCNTIIILLRHPHYGNEEFWNVCLKTFNKFQHDLSHNEIFFIIFG